MKKNYKMTICYDGTRYYGWEHQPDRDTIQGKLESVLEIMCGEFVDVIGAGRTDAGVHARAMVANAVMDIDKTPEEIRDYMNRYLPDDIAVEEVREASERFHARYKAAGKTYCYTCFDGPVKPVFNRKYYTRLNTEVDVDKMQRAASYLVGEHDFKSFCGNPKMKKSTVRIVDRIEIRRNKGYIYFTFHGTGFLQNMVRILVGTLLEVGRGDMAPEQVKDILEAKDRKMAGPTAPPEGLCLMKVDY
ncbi:MAG: tRNA pseudouridine(38-40) synthase TruA [Lachnospiraceae bacterium]|nr:tRNA pseudouridine(38-40) synthase TruA [Lachnospiraceae bacterium]